MTALQESVDSGDSEAGESGPAAKLLDTASVIGVPDAARLLGISRSTAYDAARRGDLPSLRLGRRVVVPVEPLRRLLGIGSGHCALCEPPVTRQLVDDDGGFRATPLSPVVVSLTKSDQRTNTSA